MNHSPVLVDPAERARHAPPRGPVRLLERSARPPHLIRQNLAELQNFRPDQSRDPATSHPEKRRRPTLIVIIIVGIGRVDPRLAARGNDNASAPKQERLELGSEARELQGQEGLEREWEAAKSLKQKLRAQSHRLGLRSESGHLREQKAEWPSQVVHSHRGDRSTDRQRSSNR